MKTVVGKTSVLATMVCVLFLGAFVASARADSLDFTCGLGGCGGTVTFATSGSFVTSASASNITNVVQILGGNFLGESFTLAFDTGAGTISLTGNSGDTLSGTFSGFGFSGCTTLECAIAAGATWNSLSSGVQTALGTTTGLDIALVGWSRSNGAADSVDISVLAVPEPSSLALLGSGLLAIGGILRRRLHG